MVASKPLRQKIVPLGIAGTNQGHLLNSSQPLDLFQTLSSGLSVRQHFVVHQFLWDEPARHLFCSVAMNS